MLHHLLDFVRDVLRPAPTPPPKRLCPSCDATLTEAQLREQGDFAYYICGVCNEASVWHGHKLLAGRDNSYGTEDTS